MIIMVKNTKKYVMSPYASHLYSSLACERQSPALVTDLLGKNKVLMPFSPAMASVFSLAVTTYTAIPLR